MKNVTLNVETGKWLATLVINGVFKNLGYFNSEFDAEDAVDEAIDNGINSRRLTAVQTSKQTGVSRSTNSKMWYVSLNVNGVTKSFGRYVNESDAIIVAKRELKRLGRIG